MTKGQKVEGWYSVNFSCNTLQQVENHIWVSNIRYTILDLLCLFLVSFQM